MGQTPSASPLGCFALVVMGPSGSGKSTLAQALASTTGHGFLEGDEHHPPGNLCKLAAGVPLTDAERQPFIDNIGEALARSERPVVVSCSALRRAHRDRLRLFAQDIVFVWVDVPHDELERRMQQRRGHFMPLSLLADQLANFEPPAPPERFIRLDGNLTTAEQVDAVARRLEAFG